MYEYHPTVVVRRYSDNSSMFRSREMFLLGIFLSTGRCRLLSRIGTGNNHDKHC